MLVYFWFVKRLKVTKHFIMVKVVSKSEISVNKLIEDLQVEKYGWESKFYKIAPKKIYAKNLLIGFWEMQRKGKNSLRNWAVECGMLLNNKSISKQAVDGRLTDNCLKMMELILSEALTLKYKFINKKLNSTELNDMKYLFNRILLQDSTIQSLPADLCKEFPPSHTSGKKAAMLRLQATFDLTNMCWVAFFIGAFTNNDQSQSKAIAKVAEKKDLILRDLGYFTLESLELLMTEQYVITKWDNKSNLYYNCDDKKLKNTRIDLLKLFKNEREIDILVQVGSKKRLNMRLIAKKLPKPQAKKRIEEAKNDRHSKSNHSEKYYKLLEWEIFLTNVEQDKLDIEQVAKLYGLRWFIEILFKSWKSHCNFKKMLGKEKMNYIRMMITIHLLLIEFVYFMLDIFQYISVEVAKITDKLISILKFMDLVNDLFDYIVRIEKLEDLDVLIPSRGLGIAHATYERRNKRKNMMQKTLEFSDFAPFLFTA
ncbi:MAG: IS4 family transposase [Saprospiraceae bacterium]